MGINDKKSEGLQTSSKSTPNQLYTQPVHLGFFICKNEKSAINDLPNSFLPLKFGF